jgi:hypothetical protein
MPRLKPQAHDDPTPYELSRLAIALHNGNPQKSVEAYLVTALNLWRRARSTIQRNPIPKVGYREVLALFPGRSETERLPNLRRFLERYLPGPHPGKVEKFIANLKEQGMPVEQFAWIRQVVPVWQPRQRSERARKAAKVRHAKKSPLTPPAPT